MRRFIFYILLFFNSFWLAACVSLSDEVKLNIFSYPNNTTVISVSVARIGIYKNIHGGKFDGYYIEVPRSLDIVESDQIRRSGLDSTNWKILKKSRIAIHGQGPCEITIEVYAPDGKPMLFSGLNINGTHKVDANNCVR